MRREVTSTRVSSVPTIELYASVVRRSDDPIRVTWEPRGIAFAEVAAGRTDPTSYAARWNTMALPFDFVWFTPRATDDDPCGDVPVFAPRP